MTWYRVVPVPGSVTCITVRTGQYRANAVFWWHIYTQEQATMRDDLNQYLRAAQAVRVNAVQAAKTETTYINIDGALVTKWLPLIAECPMTAKDHSRALHACHIQAGTAPQYVRLSAAYTNNGV